MFARKGSVVVGVLLVALAGCGGDGTTSESTVETLPQTETTTPSSTGQLTSLLLDTSDVGAGWQVGPEVTDADLNDAHQIPCPDFAINPVIAARLRPIVGAQFEPVDRSSKHLIEFAVSRDPEQLDADLRVLFDAMDACSASTPTTTATGSLTVAPLTLPSLGDQRAAYMLIGVESSEVTWYVRSADVRVGPVGITLGLTEILADPDAAPSVSDDEFVDLVTAAVTKFAGGAAGIANPASVFCIEQGGRVVIVDETDGQVGYCELPDGRRIEEWEYFRSQVSTSEP